MSKHKGLHKEQNLLSQQIQLTEKLQIQLKQYQKLFNVEMSCKNQAYFFILECGYFDKYKEYIKQKPVKN
ncbi:hypothetical protein [Tenacibaculum maritimum]|uniref:hypothetical protein n=1 Tax=Tenacibaculum maritimum TaxID=107401 RepID=UPI0010A3FA48|nr:hypothetical protein [Tenacibaculum maritimum]QCD61275.1 hypothetical protein B9C57_01375 [Tenacibaculum maritimum]